MKMAILLAFLLAGCTAPNQTVEDAPPETSPSISEIAIDCCLTIDGASIYGVVEGESNVAFGQINGPSPDWGAQESTRPAVFRTEGGTATTKVLKPPFGLFTDGVVTSGLFLNDTYHFTTFHSGQLFCCIPEIRTENHEVVHYWTKDFVVWSFESIGTDDGVIEIVNSDGKLLFMGQEGNGQFRKPWYEPVFGPKIRTYGASDCVAGALTHYDGHGYAVCEDIYNRETFLLRFNETVNERILDTDCRLGQFQATTELFLFLPCSDQLINVQTGEILVLMPKGNEYFIAAKTLGPDIIAAACTPLEEGTSCMLSHMTETAHVQYDFSELPMVHEQGPGLITLGVDGNEAMVTISGALGAHLVRVDLNQRPAE